MFNMTAILKYLLCELSSLPSGSLPASEVGLDFLGKKVVIQLRSLVVRFLAAIDNTWTIITT